MKIKEARLKTLHMYDDKSPEDDDYSLWIEIAKFMDGEIAVVVESSLSDDHYVFLWLKNEEKNKELFYMMEQDSMIGIYIDDRKGFDKVWDSGAYAPDTCFYLNSENVELLEGGAE